MRWLLKIHHLGRRKFPVRLVLAIRDRWQALFSDMCLSSDHMAEVLLTYCALTTVEYINPNFRARLVHSIVEWCEH